MAGDPFVGFDAIRRLTRHNDQLLPYALKKDGYPDPGARNGALGLVTAEFLSIEALLLPIISEAVTPFLFYVISGQELAVKILSKEIKVTIIRATWNPLME